MSQAVIFLARGIDAGLPAARAFFDSYRAHPAGRPHALIVIAKGWEAVPGRDQLQALAESAGARVVNLPDDGFDWGAYMRIAPQLSHDWVCFLNSHSQIMAGGWLDKLRSAAEQPGVGAAGATGSWGTLAPVASFIVPNVADISHERGWAAAALRAGYIGSVGYVWGMLKDAPDFPAFPNPHLRSNAFILRRSLFQDFTGDRTPPYTKREAFQLECGRQGMTRWLKARGLAALVVAAGGEWYATGQWMASGTFRTPGHAPQNGRLLISDNQTRGYDAAAPFSRRIMERSAWGRAFTPRGRKKTP